MPGLDAPPPHVMQCSEVWGGIDPVDRAVTMQGLDAFVLSRPFAGDEAGGDIHYLSSCATGRITRALIADVSGHGAAVATTAANLRALMRRFVNYIDQTRLTAALNAEFAASAADGRFATAVVVTYWTPTDDIELTIAGHPPPLLYRASDAEWGRLAPGPAADPDQGLPRNLPLGVLDATAYSRSRARLARGDLLLLYTDGAPEAQSPDGRQLGEAGLLRLLRDLGPPTAETLLGDLAAAIDRFAGGAGHGDDMTLLLLRPNALKPRGSLSFGLRTGVRLARELGVFLRGGERFAMPQLSFRNFAGAFIDRVNRRGRGC